MTALAMLAGAALWTLVEYLLHRFVCHELGVDSRIAREHLRHHRGDDRALTASKVAAAAVTWFAVAYAVGVLTDPAIGISFASGLVGMYAVYEYLHARTHDSPPTNAYARWRLEHHRVHHRTSRVNHGVTSPLWDLVFGTYRRAGR